MSPARKKEPCSEYRIAVSFAEGMIFRGVRGHLATVMSEAEWEFVYGLIVGKIGFASTGVGHLAWLAAETDPGGVNRNWKWIQGDEVGVFFSTDAGPVPGEFSRFLAQSPVPARNQGRLLMRGSHGQWSATSGDGWVQPCAGRMAGAW